MDWVILSVGIALAVKWYIGIARRYLHWSLYAPNFQLHMQSFNSCQTLSKVQLCRRFRLWAVCDEIGRGMYNYFCSVYKVESGCTYTLFENVNTRNASHSRATAPIFNCKHLFLKQSKSYEVKNSSGYIDFLFVKIDIWNVNHAQATTLILDQVLLLLILMHWHRISVSKGDKMLSSVETRGERTEAYAGLGG